MAKAQLVGSAIVITLPQGMGDGNAELGRDDGQKRAVVASSAEDLARAEPNSGEVTWVCIFRKL